MRVIARGVTSLDEVKAAAAVGVDAVSFVVESKGEPRNIDITEVTETARGAPPFVSVVVDTVTDDEKRLRRTIGSAHPHAVVMGAGIDPMILADLQVSFPEVKWLARLSPTEYEPFHDGADALVFPAAEAEAAARVKEATRSRIIMEGVTPENVDAIIADIKPFAVMVDAADADAVKRIVDAARRVPE